MSKLPLAPIFSAAHVAKWDDPSYEEPEARIWPTWSKFGAKETPPSLVPATHQPHVAELDEHVQLSESSNTLGGSIFSRRECEITVRVREASVGAARNGNPLVTESRGIENMAVKTHTWITLWFLLTTPVIFWDASYCFMRPRSMVGGDLHWIWEPYGIYQNIDHLYGVKALEDNNGFTNAQSLLNLVETAFNLAYVYLAHVSNWPGAPLIGFAAATMTFSKTVLYWLQEYYCSGCATGHNSLANLLLYWVLPNGLWLVFPSMIVYRLGCDIIGSLSVASRSAHKTASGKMQ